LFPPELFIFVEGEADKIALPRLCRRALKHLLGSAEWSRQPLGMRECWKVGHVGNLVANGYEKWRRHLGNAARMQASAVLLILDGDRLSQGCPVAAARRLVAAAGESGAGSKFSLAVVFAMQEIESWFIPDAKNLLGRDAKATLGEIPGDPEKSPRDAKGWFKANRVGGYGPTANCGDFAERVDLRTVEGAGLRSFQRFENALIQIHTAAYTGKHSATPSG
jgi:hypothetical protein